MNPDSLSQLRDIHLPPEPGFWPPAPGWWLLAGIIIGLIIFGFILFLRWQRRAALRQALFELDGIESRYSTNQNQTQLTINISQLLRRSALTAFPRNQVASLTGEEWLTFLYHTGKSDFFKSPDALILTTGPYQKNDACLCGGSVKASQLIDETRNWIKTNLSRGSKCR